MPPEKTAEKAEVYFCFSNHAKIVMTNNIAYIGLSNFSEESADNFESGFISKDADFIEFLEEEIFPWIMPSVIPIPACILQAFLNSCTQT